MQITTGKWRDLIGQAGRIFRGYQMKWLRSMEGMLRSHDLVDHVTLDGPESS